VRNKQALHIFNINSYVEIRFVQQIKDPICFSRNHYGVVFGNQGVIREGSKRGEKEINMPFLDGDYQSLSGGKQFAQD